MIRQCGLRLHAGFAWRLSRRQSSHGCCPDKLKAPVDETTAGTDLAQDTLTKADRLEITYVASGDPQPSPHCADRAFIPTCPENSSAVEPRLSAGTGGSKRQNLIGASPSEPKQAVAAKKGKSVDSKAIRLRIVPSHLNR